VIQFDRRAKGFKLGEQWTIAESSSDTVAVFKGHTGPLKLLPLDQAAACKVYKTEQMPLADGDVVREPPLQKCSGSSGPMAFKESDSL
jgi:hypothetical protein